MPPALSNDAPITALRIVVRPSPDTNDHEVCLLGDGEDLITRFARGNIGLDPDDILRKPSPLAAQWKPHVATIGRCDCGVIGCGSVEVTIGRDAERVTWRSESSGIVVQFEVASYDREVARAMADFSWETPDRTTARLIATAVDRHALAQRGLTFEWASGRLRPHTMSLSLRYEPGPYQLVVHVHAKDAAPEDVARDCAALMLQDPARWRHVVWYPQQRQQDAPAIAGPGWKKGPL
jgi:hypothetical protein